MFDLTSNDPIQPFLRWAGGKQQLLSRMARFLPNDVRERRFFEPFAGAASMFLAVKPVNGYLADANELLIQCYCHVRDNPDLIADYLLDHARNNSEDYYYQIRDRFNQAGDSVAQSARFIYLNKTCFNGIYRVNQKGAFNVPYGHKDPPALPSRHDLRQVSEALQQIELISAPFSDVLDMAGEDDFVYLDPPYPPLNGTSYFTHYTANRFDWDDHVELSGIFQNLSERGCMVMMSNANHSRIRRLFRGFNLYTINVTRFITCKNIKHKVRELVITNYDVF